MPDIEFTINLITLHNNKEGSMEREEGGCFKNLIYFVAVVFFILWLSDVNTIQITQQMPAPQDSWEIVYPQFRDDVSSQLLNTQNMLGIALEDVDNIKAQNSDIQYSVDILLSELGIIQRKSDIENKRQRIENFALTGVSLFLGWLLSGLATPKQMKQKIDSLFSPNRRRITTNESINQDRTIETQVPNITYWYVIQNDLFARVLLFLVICVIVALGITSIDLLFR